MTATETTVTKRTSLVDALLPRRGASNRITLTSEEGWSPRSATVTAAGQRVNGSTALTLSACWAATNTIAGLFGALPFKSYRKTGSLRKEATTHPTYRILSREPNPEMDSFVFWEMMTQWWVNYGNAFAEIQRLEESDRIHALWPVHPSRVTPIRDEKGVWLNKWEIQNKNAKPSTVESKDMLNIIGALSDDGLTGKGVLAYAAHSIGIGLAEQNYKGDFYGNGGRPSGVLEHPTKFVSEKARDELRREWKEVHGKSNEIAVLWEGMKFNTISVDPEHAKLLESQLFSVQEMSRFYDLPPHVLYELSKGTFANVEEMNRFLVSHSFGKRLLRVEKAIDRQLFNDLEKDAGYYSKFNVNALLRGNPKEQAEINQIKLNCGVINQDEWRSQDDQNPLPEDKGSHYWMRRDTATIDLILESGGTLDGSQAIPETPPTPDTPPTPPVPSETENQLRAQVDALTVKCTRRGRKNKALAAQLAELLPLPNQLADLQVEADARQAEVDRCAKVIGDQHGTINELTTERDNLSRSAIERDRANELLAATQEAYESVKAIAENNLAEWKAESERLIAKTAEHAALIERNTLLAASVNEAAEKLTAATSERDAVNAQLTETVAKLAEAGSFADTLEASRDELAKQRDELTSKLTQAEKLAEDAGRCLTALESDVEAAKTAMNAAETAKSTVESELTATRERLTNLEDESKLAIKRATERGDEMLAKSELLSVEIGTTKAERDTLRAQVDAMTVSRESLAESLAAAEKLAEESQIEATTAHKTALEAKTNADQQIADARLSVVASVRTLLDQSLQSLLVDEREEMRNASRKEDRFKEIVGNYYHHMQERLTSQLSTAASALEKLGCSRVDVAKIASQYVAESRSKLNNLAHTVGREDLRAKVSGEVKLWEDRKQTLIDWIGE